MTAIERWIERGRDRLGIGALGEQSQDEAEPPPEQAADALARTGDAAGVSVLYAMNFDEIYGLFRLALNDANEAEDATFLVFIEAVSRIRMGDLRGATSLAAWMQAIARRQLEHRLCERVRTAPARGGGAAEPRHIRSVTAETALRALAGASDDDLHLLLDCLPEPQRLAVVLNAVLGFSHSEVAAMMGRSGNSVRNLEESGLSRLGEHLASIGREAARGPQGELAMTRRRTPLTATRAVSSVTLR